MNKDCIEDFLDQIESSKTELRRWVRSAYSPNSGIRINVCEQSLELHFFVGNGLKASVILHESTCEPKDWLSIFSFEKKFYFS